MLAALLPLADAASEGRSIILMMLATGLVFIAVIAIGDLAHYLAHKRQAKKTRAL